MMREQQYEIQEEEAARVLLQVYRVDIMLTRGGGDQTRSSTVAAASTTADQDYETAVEEDDGDEDAWLGTNLFSALHTSKSR